MSGAYWGDRTDTSPQALADRRLRLPCKECGGTYERRSGRVKHYEGCWEVRYTQQDLEEVELRNEEPTYRPFMGQWPDTAAAP